MSPSGPSIKMTVDQVRAEVQPEGYRFDKTIVVLPQRSPRPCLNPVTITRPERFPLIEN
jgi:hypothetical protein